MWGSACSASSALIVVLLCVACGKKGPPLPPLVKLPAAPADLTAERRGNVVDLQFTVPATNTDGTRPANISRADAYAVTLPGSVMPATVEMVSISHAITRPSVLTSGAGTSRSSPSRGMISSA